MKMLLYSAVFFILASCSNSKKITAGSQNYNLEGEWELISINSRPADVISAGKKPFVKFDLVANRISGSTGCNSFGGPLKLTGMSINLKQPFMMTKMFCEGVDESGFMNTFERGTLLHFQDENTLQLLAETEVLMVFKRRI